MYAFLEKEFIDAGYKIEKLAEELYLVEDFITDEELAELWDVINNTPEDDWKIHYRAHLAKFCMEKFGRDDVENLVAEGKYDITKGWDDKNLAIGELPPAKAITKRINSFISKVDPELITHFGIFQRMPEGVDLTAHTDQFTDPSIRYAAVIYLNDDYTEGEIFWSNKNIKIKPKTKSMVIFPGTDEYNHGVTHVGKGPIRYVMPAFIKVRGFYDNNKY